MHLITDTRGPGTIYLHGLRLIINFRQVGKSDRSMHSGVFALRISLLSDFGTYQL